MTNSADENPVRSFREVIDGRVTGHRRAWEAKAAGKAVLTTIPTGITGWDIELGVLTIIGAPTGEGKSVVMMHLAKSAAIAGHNVLVLSFEDPASKTADRALSGATGIHSRRLGRLEYDEGGLEQIEAAVVDLDWTARIEFHDGLMTTAQAGALVERFRGRLVLIDYAQAFPDNGSDSRERMLAEFAWKLNMAAQQRHMAVVMFSQTKPDIQKRGRSEYASSANRDQGKGRIDGFRPGPGNTDLTWSTALGERCKCLVYLFRPGRWGRKMGDAAMKDDTMEIIIDKCNFGEEGTIVVKWDGARSLISERKR